MVIAKAHTEAFEFGKRLGNVWRIRAEERTMRWLRLLVLEGM